MILSDKDLIILKDYADGLLSEVEKTELKQRIDQDADFRNEAFAYLKTIAVLKEKSEQAAREKIKEWEEENPFAIENEPNRFSTWQYASAAMALAACMEMWIFKPWIPANEKLAMAYAKPFPIERDKGSEQNAMELYADKSYKKAAIAFESDFSKNQKDTSALLFAAVSHLKSENYQKCIDLITPIAQSGREDRYDAQWFEALAYLAKNDLPKSKFLLQNLIEKSDAYRDEAEKLLSEVEKLSK